MRRAFRFVIALVVALAALTWLAQDVVKRTTRNWFETDIALRARLAATSGSAALLERWENGDRAGIQSVLGEISHDEWIMATALCGANGEPVAATEAYPATLDCASVAKERGRAQHPRSGQAWFYRVEQPEGPIHVSAVSIGDDRGRNGFVVLVHDLGYVERRETGAQTLVLLVFSILAIAASAATLLAVRMSRQEWAEGLRNALRNGDRPREFQPLLRDVRDLAERLAETDPERGGGKWTAERLKRVLEKDLDGDRIIVLANREPYVHERADDGIRVVHPASGLVTAMEPVMRACSGVWVAHASGSADKETVDDKNRVRVPPGEESYMIRRVWLTPEEEQGYYYGFSNEGLWPLCHVAHTRPAFRESDWNHYSAVNERFAEAVCDEAETDDPVILVQDYHFALAPRMIRKRLPRATILTFWHIPWPNAERFGICPWRNEIVEGLLGSSILGFHTRQHCNQFLDGVDAFVESRIDREKNAVVQGARSTLVRPYPISIDWPVKWLEGLPPPAECRRQLFAELGLPANAKLGVGIDRLDYTKGIEERLLAVEKLLEQRPEYIGRFYFAQLAAPSRVRIGKYQELAEVVEQRAAQINERFGKDGYKPIILLRSHHEPPTVYKYYRAADLCYVSSLHDGMNLVAKEFVAAREDERGVLLLSQFTGAARELTEALIVNPYDLEEASAALAAALDMPEREQALRMRSMRTLVADLNVYRWAGRMLIDAAAVRRKERLSGRLSTSWSPLRGATT
jgi:trehalose 6-phosphate synthase